MFSRPSYFPKEEYFSFKKIIVACHIRINYFIQLLNICNGLWFCKLCLYFEYVDWYSSPSGTPLLMKHHYLVGYTWPCICYSFMQSNQLILGLFWVQLSVLLQLMKNFIRSQFSWKLHWFHRWKSCIFQLCNAIFLVWVSLDCS